MKISFGDTARVAFEVLRWHMRVPFLGIVCSCFRCRQFFEGRKGEFPSEPLAFQGVQPDILLFYL